MGHLLLGFVAHLLWVHWIHVLQVLRLTHLGLIEIVGDRATQVLAYRYDLKLHLLLLPWLIGLRLHSVFSLALSGPLRTRATGWLHSRDDDHGSTDFLQVLLCLGVDDGRMKLQSFLGNLLSTWMSRLKFGVWPSS